MTLSVAKRKEIEGLLADGHAVSQISKHVGCSPTTVFRIKRGVTKTPLAEELAEVRAIIHQNPAAKALEISVEDNDWEAIIPETLKNGMVYLRDALKRADEQNPRIISAVTASVKDLAELHTTLRFINQRFER